MARFARKNLQVQGMKEAVTCSICQELFTDARALTCNHCFCLRCLQNLQKTAYIMPCPMCRSETVPAARELCRLLPNRAANDMVSLLFRHKNTEGKTVFWSRLQERLLLRLQDELLLLCFCVFFVAFFVLFCLNCD